MLQYHQLVLFIVKYSLIIPPVKRATVTNHNKQKESTHFATNFTTSAK